MLGIILEHLWNGSRGCGTTENCDCRMASSMRLSSMKAVEGCHSGWN